MGTFFIVALLVESVFEYSSSRGPWTIQVTDFFHKKTNKLALTTEFGFLLVHWDVFITDLDCGWIRSILHNSRTSQIPMIQSSSRHYLGGLKLLGSSLKSSENPYFHLTWLSLELFAPGEDREPTKPSTSRMVKWYEV
jgi:hypothetical protein